MWTMALSCAVTMVSMVGEIGIWFLKHFEFVYIIFWVQYSYQWSVYNYHWDRFFLFSMTRMQSEGRIFKKIGHKVIQSQSGKKMTNIYSFMQKEADMMVSMKQI
jgi:hypothetical protein